jgi:hydroxymethylpyrimidine/phosphomethylpyrimidine kinase
LNSKDENNERNIQEAVAVAKDFIHAAISFELGIGSGHGPTNHWAYKREGIGSL